MDSITESQLIMRSQEGDEAAVADLVEKHAQAIFRLALSVLDDPEEAEEAAQEAWINALNHLDRFRGEASFRTWLFAITLNTCRSRLRKRDRLRRIEEVLTSIFHLRKSDRSHPEEAFLEKERGDQVSEAIRSLRENERLAILLRYYHELPIAQIAQIMQVSERTVYVRLRDAHIHLKTVLGSGEDKR